MHLASDASTVMYLKSSGQRLLEADEGVAWFERLLGQQGAQHLLLAGQPARVRRFLGMDAPATVQATAPAIPVSAGSTGGRRAEMRGMTLAQCVEWDVKQCASAVLQIARERLDVQENLAAFGFDSISLATFAAALSRQFEVEVTPSVFFGYPTLSMLCEHLIARHAPLMESRYRETSAQAQAIAPVRFSQPASLSARRFAAQGPASSVDEPIAIIGMSGRFPQARNIDELWRILSGELDVIESLTEARGAGWNTDGCRAGFVPGADEFDPLFFEISPRDAEAMDPRQRLLMQEAWNALEHAGYGATSLKTAKVGMFVGAEEGDHSALAHGEGGIGAAHAAMLAARLAYFLNTRGPAMVINTACSSGLVAAHQAIQSLRSGECDTAVAAGVSLMLSPEPVHAMARAGMLSLTGRCRAFDADADGMVPGEAVAVVVLKRLSQALADGDQVHAVIRGSGINYDGRTNGITAPNGVAQTELVRSVMQRAQVRPEEISYVVAHGTGTRLGDPVEINALNDAFKREDGAAGYCALTSPKTNLGHTLAASGLVGLISLVQALRHETIPASLHCDTENAFIEWDGSPFFVNKASRPWAQQPGRPRLAAVSAFGMSGTNAHMVVAQHAAPVLPMPLAPCYLLVLSAKTAPALGERVQDLIASLDAMSDATAPMAAISHTLLTGRHHFAHRCALVASDRGDALYALRQLANGEQPAMSFRGVVAREFAPQAALQQYVGELVQRHAQASTDADACRELLAGLADLYCQGYALDDARLFGARTPSRISLPTYPFARTAFPLGAEGRHAGMASRAARPAQQLPAQDTADGVHLLRPTWKTADKSPSQAAPAVHRTVMVCGFDGVSKDHLEGALPGVRCIVVNCDAGAIDEDYIHATQTLLSLVQDIARDRSAQPALLQVLVPSIGKEQIMAGLTGLLRTARLEHPAVQGQLIGVEPGKGLPWMLDKLRAAAGLDVSCLRYEGDDAFGADWVELADAAPAMHPWRDGGVYLITGGAGGLGRIIAREIASRAAAPVLVLAGRSEPGDATVQLLAELAGQGAQALYRRLDVQDRDSVGRLVDDIVVQFGTLHGIVHCAGVLRDSFIVNKTAEGCRAVLEPKVAGVVGLDEASKALPLDLFIVFSSMAAVGGNPGQADYAAANGFMDAYATYRNRLVTLEQRHGRSLSVNWPLWSDGGMRMDGASVRLMEQAGARALAADEGTRALYRAIQSGEDQVLVLAGDLPRMLDSLASPARGSAMAAPTMDGAARLDALERVIALLTGIVSRMLKIDPADIDQHAELSMFGFDSISFTDFAGALRDACGARILPTVFFEYPTLNAVAQYLIRDHGAGVLAAIGAASDDSGASQPHGEWPAAAGPLAPSDPDRPEPIAIVGISCDFPQAVGADAFWRNLVEGRDCVGEVPADRWDWKVHADAAALGDKAGALKWGGFIDAVDKFDPLFFGISPTEAELMDPQQRLLMTHVWKAIEDAGYAPASLSGTRTALFIGTGGTGYDGVIAQANAAMEAYSATASVPSLGPNRMSYLLNLHGPSEPVETACSSALVALRRGVLAIENGDSEMAIVGGVNTMVSPHAHVVFSKAGMLSADGRCKTFSDKADGYVRGEGVGMLVLKRLSVAERDGDHIYGVIRGSAENHGGRATSLTAPNPKAQAALVAEAVRKAGIDPRSVGYIEAHGTGTELGDPVEINGLKSAFRELYAASGDALAQPHCGLGSVKTNIGHLELAAGAAGVIKVLLQLKHKTLVKSLHCDTVNPYIDLKDSPFYIVRETQAWDAPRDAQGRELPRRAGVSSFGFGGVNAHVVIEEYVPSGTRPAGHPALPALIVLSAKTPARLRDQAAQLLAWLEDKRPADADLVDIAYTLQVGRDAMEERLAFVVKETAQMVAVLRAFVSDTPASTTYHVGRMPRSKTAAQVSAEDDALKRMAAACIAGQDAAPLLELWVNGGSMDWNALYGAHRPARVSLPTYPFAPDRYWVRARAADGAGQGAVMHPLAQRNTSNLRETRFSASFDGREAFFADHQVKGLPTFPGVAYLEWVRAAAAGMTDLGDGMRLANVVWKRPLVVDGGPVEAHVRLVGSAADVVSFEVYGAESTVHCHGDVASLSEPARRLDIDALLAAHDEELSGEACYRAFTSGGLAYGPAFQTIDTLYVGEQFALAKLELSSPLDDRFALPPGLLDGALQATTGLLRRDGGGRIGLPFVVQAVDIWKACEPSMWAVVRCNADDGVSDKVRHFDIELCGMDGHVHVRFTRLTLRMLESGQPFAAPAKAPAEAPKGEAGHMWAPVWDTVSIPAQQQAPRAGDRVLVVGGDAGRHASLRARFADARIAGLPREAGIDAIADHVARQGAFDHVVWIAPATEGLGVDGEPLLGAQEHGLIQLFRLVKALLGLGYGAKTLGWTIVTEQAQEVARGESVQPAHAGVHGLAGALAKEYPNWSIRLADLERGRWPQETLFALPFDEEGDTWAYRGGQWYRQRLLPVALADGGPAAYRRGGVYVVIGGAGGIGEAWSDHMIRTYGAQVIWLGRRPLDAAIAAKCRALGELGPTPRYIAADAGDVQALDLAYQQIKHEFGQINGLVHAAVVLLDKSVAQMDEERFRASLRAKVDTSVRMAQVFAAEALDFVLFFSSLQSFSRSAGQSNYAAGCTFNDAFAHQLRMTWPCAVKVMNWGYWGGVGVAAGEDYRRRMARNGVAAIEAPEAMVALESLMRGPLHQLAFVKTAEGSVLAEMGQGEHVQIYSEQLASTIHSLKLDLAPVERDLLA
jgi:polyketide synthase PksN